ncbi:MAG: putative glycolipid-binding domain-containing protein [Kineosporiaceae bacterium]
MASRAILHDLAIPSMKPMSRAWRTVSADVNRAVIVMIVSDSLTALMSTLISVGSRPSLAKVKRTVCGAATSWIVHRPWISGPSDDLANSPTEVRHVRRSTDWHARPAVFVRATGAPDVIGLDQTYGRPSASDADGRRSVDYACPTFGVAAVLTYDRFGLVLDYPDLARRHH